MAIGIGKKSCVIGNPKFIQPSPPWTQHIIKNTWNSMTWVYENNWKYFLWTQSKKWKEYYWNYYHSNNSSLTRNWSQ